MGRRLTPLRDRQLGQGNVVVHVRGVLHSAAEGPIVLQGGVAYAYGRVPFVHVSGPGNPVSERARRAWVLERLVVENLRKQHTRRKSTWTT